jgi:hypothetical protein
MVKGIAEHTRKYFLQVASLPISMSRTESKPPSRMSVSMVTLFRCSHRPLRKSRISGGPAKAPLTS